MGRQVGQKMAQKIGYPLWMAPIMKNWTRKVLFVFFILFFLMDAILLKLDLQKRTMWEVDFFSFPTFSNKIRPKY